MDANIRCVVCGLNLEDDIAVVKARGLETCIQSSIVRDDGKAESFMNRSEIKLHKACRNSYNNPRCIIAAQKRLKKRLVKEGDSNSEYDFQTRCLFCNKDASLLFEQQQSKNSDSNRVVVYQVDKLETLNTILQACSANDDYWSRQVSLRINQVDILEKNARYHYYCYNNFCHSNRLQSQESGTAMEMDPLPQFEEDSSMSDSESSVHSVKREPAEEADEVIDLDPEPEVTPEPELPVKQEQEPELEVSAPDELNVSDPLRTSDCLKAEPAAYTPPAKPTRKIVCCQICDNVLSPIEVNVTPKGLRKLQSSSERRMDNKFPWDFQGQVLVHKDCRSKYVNPGSIEAAFRRATENVSAMVSDMLTADDDELGDQMKLRLRGHKPNVSEHLSNYDRLVGAAIRNTPKNVFRALPHTSVSDGRADQMNVTPRGHKTIFPSVSRDASEMSWPRPEPSGFVPMIRIPSGQSGLELVPLQGPLGSRLEPSTGPAKTNVVPQRPFDKVEKCRICGGAMTRDLITVRYKGYLNLQRASELRQDNKFPAGTEHELIEVRLHTNCRKSYIKDCSIRMSIQMRTERELNPGAYEHERFNYLEQCIFCGGDASDAFMKNIMKKPSNRRQESVCRIRNLDTVDGLYRTSLDYPDSEYGEFRKRVKDKNLVALHARYHLSCYVRFKLPRKNKYGPGKRGRPYDEEVQGKMPLVYDYIENNWEDSQFHIKDLKEVGDVCNRTMFTRFEERYGYCFMRKNEMVITTPPKNLLEDKWHEQALDDEKSERLRIVKTAANIILEDIRSIYFDNKQNYPAASSFLAEVNSVIPETLRTFVETVVTKYNKNPEPKESTVVALSHSIMTAARPRSFKSPLLLGIGSLIHQKYASKSLIDLLSSIGFCASYKDVTQLEVSMASKDFKGPKPDFTPFVFDSVESDNGPIVVGVECNTPRNDETTIAKRDHVPESRDGRYSATLLKHLASPGLEKVVIEDHRDDTAILPTRSDALWLLGKSEQSLNLPAWDTFISKMPSDKEYPVSEIRPLPVIEAAPSNTSINTALKEAQKKIKDICIVTFDQPMYQKAQEIVKCDSEMSNVVLKLGSFDVIKSFLGVIGYIMSGSGLKELWCSLYAAEHIEKMMTGHAFARAVRAHFLTRSALFNIITKDFDITPEERLEIEGILEGDYIPEDNNQRSYQEPLAITLELLERKGPTAQLWVQYFRMTTLAAQFLEAERTANWDLHLSTLKKMLPYFHAGGYFGYAKSCSLYLQDMKALETKMNEEEFEKFTKKGYFAVRWTEDFDWSDRAVEKTMTLLKRPGGLTNGTKVSDDYLASWLSASPALSIVSQLVEKFCRYPRENAESSINKDNRDSTKIQSWFKEHDPFAETCNLVSLSTDKSGSDLNCHEAEMIGKQMMDETIGQNYVDVSYDRSKCARTLSVDKSIEIEDLQIPIEPDTVLKRIANIPVTKKNQKEKIKSFFQYELAPYPMSLFDDQGMFEANKSSLFDQFVPVEIADGQNNFHVVDGEFLLNRVTWKDDMTVSAISYSYVEYIKTRFKNAIVVFGGNKVSETARRSKVKKSPVVEFQKDTVLTIDKESFLANEKNRDRFIQYLMIDFTRSGIKIKLQSNDLHSNIILTAIESASTYENTFIVSNNADLLIKMCVLSNTDNVYFMKPSRNPKYFHFNSIESNKLQISMLFLHAVSGCGSTSAIFNQGKKRVGAKLGKMYMKDIKNLMTIFASPASEKNEIAEVGINFIRHLYDDVNKYDDFNALRYDRFTKSVTKSRYDLACIPPSKDAIKQHMYRTYHQIQKWLGNDLSPSEWGWKSVGDRLEPIYSDKIAPKELIAMISCNCEGVCSIDCTCKRIHLNCCVLCLNCNGKSCHGLEMDADSGIFNAHLKCDAFGNPVDPAKVNNDDDEDIEKQPEASEPVEPRPKRAKRDTAPRVYDEEMREEEVRDEEMRQHQEVEHVYVVQSEDDE